MKKGKLMGKIFGITLVFVLFGPMLEGLLATPFPSTKSANRTQALAQGAPELQWSKTFGGAGYQDGCSAQQTSAEVKL